MFFVEYIMLHVIETIELSLFDSIWRSNMLSINIKGIWGGEPQNFLKF